MAIRRKLFLTHAGELAHLLLRDVGRDGLVARFARTYAEHHGRRGLLSDPARLPELESTIGREALLVMAADLRRHLSREFRAGGSGTLRAEEASFVDGFYAEFLAALIRGLRWSATEAGGETEMFRRDLEMYRRWGNRPAPISIAMRADDSESPFADRCALLLDPAMMEQARRAAAEFEKQVLLTVARRFGQLGRSAIFTTRAARRPQKKSAKPRKQSARRAQKSSEVRNESFRPKQKQKRSRRRKIKKAPASKRKYSPQQRHPSRRKANPSSPKRSGRR